MPEFARHRGPHVPEFAHNFGPHVPEFARHRGPHLSEFATSYLLEHQISQQVVKDFFPDKPSKVDRQFTWTVFSTVEA